MERVETLLKKLQEEFDKQAPAEKLLLTVQQLNAELLHLQTQTGSGKTISVDIAGFINEPSSPARAQPMNGASKIPLPVEEERTVEILQIDEAEVEAELEEIKRKSEEMQRMSMHNKPAVVFDDEEEIPTLAHQQNKPAVKEINEAASGQHLSLNDKLKQGTMELGDQLVEAPIRDLRKAIGVNDRFLYIKELFRGDESMYERSIKTINGFSILAEAEYWIQRELKVKLGWNDSSDVLRQFNQLVKRRFT